MLINQPFFWEGKGDRACLFLHGLGGGVYEMQPLGEYLLQQGWSVQGINYPGHDKPSGKMPASTWQEWYAHVLLSYQQLAQQYPVVSVVGFSTGCPLGLHLAASNPFAKLVLLSPYLAIRHRPYYLVRPEVYLFSIGRWVNDLPRLRLPIRDVQMRRLAEEAAFFRSFNLPAVRSANELIAQVKAELPQIQVPTLIIQSPKDSVVDPAGAEWVYRHIGSSQKQLVWLKQSDHIVSLDVEREEVFQRVGAFLNAEA